MDRTETGAASGGPIGVTPELIRTDETGQPRRAKRPPAVFQATKLMGREGAYVLARVTPEDKVRVTMGGLFGITEALASRIDLEPEELLHMARDLERITYVIKAAAKAALAPLPELDA